MCFQSLHVVRGFVTIAFVAHTSYLLEAHALARYLLPCTQRVGSKKRRVSLLSLQADGQ